MLIGVIADDFTGASDIANTLAKGVAPDGGLRTAQFSGVPTGAAPDGIDAGVISLKSRTAPVEQAIRESLVALHWLLEQGCTQIVFKYCSTFDSTRDGNIGPVAEALAREMNADSVVFCPAFPGTGRTVYQGHLFVGDKLLNASGMEDHPLTPMTDADIRRWLGHQTTRSVGHLAHASIRQGADVIRAALRKTDADFLIADALTDDDLLALGAALAEAKLVTGGSGIAMGLPRNFIRAGAVGQRTADGFATSGPEAILVGSCSGATRVQVEVHAADHPTFAIDVPGVMAGAITPEVLLDFCQTHIGQAPLVYSSGTPDQVTAVQQRYGREALATRLDALFAETAAALVGAGFRRIVAAGGETSGAIAQAVCRALGASAMTIGPEIDPGVPILTLEEDITVALALKSGNFGAPDFFIKALTLMAGEV